MAQLPETFDARSVHPGWGSNQNNENVGTQNQRSDDELLEQHRKMESEMTENERQVQERLAAVAKAREEGRDYFEEEIVKTELVKNNWSQSWGSSSSASEYENTVVETKPEIVSGIITASIEIMNGNTGRKGANKKYHFDDIEIGQAFHVLCDSVKEASIRTSAYAAGKRLDKKFRVMKNGNYYEIARIK